MPKIGYKMSKESKEKMRQAKLRNPTRYWLGKKISLEHNAKMQAGKRKKAPTPRKGASISLQQREKTSQTLKNKYKTGELVSPLRTLGLIGRKGKDAMNWQGGKTLIGQNLRKDLSYKIWQKAVYSKDDFACQKCKLTGKKLHAHHIQNFSQYPELRLAIDNGITFCMGCHKQFHKIYGQQNNNYQQVIEYLVS